MRWFGKLITTPHVLADLSNLTDLGGAELRVIRHHFKLIVEQAEETYDASRLLVNHLVFERFGLTDAAIATVCARVFSFLPLTSNYSLPCRLPALTL